jgi:hypothetical protein
VQPNRGFAAAAAAAVMHATAQMLHFFVRRPDPPRYTKMDRTAWKQVYHYDSYSPTLARFTPFFGGECADMTEANYIKQAAAILVAARAIRLTATNYHAEAACRNLHLLIVFAINSIITANAVGDHPC